MCCGRLRDLSRPVQTRLTASRPGTLATRLEPEDVFVLADRCMEAVYHLQRNLYLPMVLESVS